MVSLAKAFALLTLLNKAKVEYDAALADDELSFEELTDLVIGLVVGIAKAFLPNMPDAVVEKLNSLIEVISEKKDVVEAKVAEVSEALAKADVVYEKFESEITAK